MLTPAYPNRGRRRDLLSELKKQMDKLPHYVYVEQRLPLKNPPLLENIEKCYMEFEASPNTVLFWSSKTPLHSPKLIYSIEDKILTFDKVVATERDDSLWISKSLYLAALGVKIWLKEDIDFIKLPNLLTGQLPADSADKEGYSLISMDELTSKL